MSKQPNLIIFNPDQWRGDVMGHLGNPAAVTPNIDSLVAETAVSFPNTFCQNTVCTPSRCSFMTGWYPHVYGHRTMHHMLHPERNEPNLLKVLKDNGYFVWWGGKNDLTPGQLPIDDYCDIRFQPTNTDYARWNLTPRDGTHGGDLAWRGEVNGDNFYSFLKGKLDKGEEPLYCDDDWANVLGALDFIRNYEGERPYCLFLALGYPHPPYCVEEPWLSMIDRTKIPPRAKPPENWSGKASILKGIWENQHLQNWDEDRWAELRATYYGMCARLDHQFGMLVDALKEMDQFDESAIFLFSDHGDYTGDFGIVEKTQNTMEDMLTRVPFVIKPPKETAVAPHISQALVELIDFSATVYELLGINPGYDSFGKSLLPLLKGAQSEHRDAVFCEGGRRKGEMHASERESIYNGNPETFTGLYAPRILLQIQDDQPYHTKATMCRTQTHKYVKRLYEQDELYDLLNDPNEESNIIHDPAYASILVALKERMLDWYMDTCDVVPHQADERQHQIRLSK